MNFIDFKFNKQSIKKQELNEVQEESLTNIPENLGTVYKIARIATNKAVDDFDLGYIVDQFDKNNVNIDLAHLTVYLAFYHQAQQDLLIEMLDSFDKENIINDPDKPTDEEL